LKTIQIWNPETRAFEDELVYGEELIRFLYDHPVGKTVRPPLTAAFLSQAYGWLQSHSSSAKKVAPFIEKFSIPMQEFEPGPFGSFNEFFIRRFKSGQRPIAMVPSEMPAPAEGRYLGWQEVTQNTLLPIKDLRIDALELLDHAPEASWFQGGPGMIARLCPVDYHRYHFMDSGVLLRDFWVRGGLESVSPIALARKPEILVTNERQVSILQTENFGRIAYIAVGAMMVGRIVDSYSGREPFKRGQEKGYFLFGGSTVVILGEPGKWAPTDEILNTTRSGFETKVKLGTVVARAIP
jgi:phosphatidylserine decarboxylase